MLGRGNSKSFVYAAQRPIDEIARFLEVGNIGPTRVTIENRNGLDRPLLVADAGIQNGVLLPK